MQINRFGGVLFFARNRLLLSVRSWKKGVSKQYWIFVTVTWTGTNWLAKTYAMEKVLVILIPRPSRSDPGTLITTADKNETGITTVSCERLEMECGVGQRPCLLVPLSWAPCLLVRSAAKLFPVFGACWAFPLAGQFLVAGDLMVQPDFWQAENAILPHEVFKTEK